MNIVTTVNEMYEAVRGNRYENQMPYPNHPSRPEKHKHYGKLAGELSSAEYAELQSYVAEYPLLHEAYVKQRKDYSAEAIRLSTLFWDDAARVCGVTDNPKRSKLECLVSEKSRSSSWADIWSEYLDLVELIR